MNHLRLTAAFVASLAVAACHGGGDEPPKDPTTAEVSPASGTAGEAATGRAPGSPMGMDGVAPTSADTQEVSTSAGPGSPAVARPGPLSDAQIVAITHAANRSEIDAGQLAAKSAQNAQVKGFAAMMVTQHTDAENKGKSIAKSAGIVPSDNETSNQIKADGESTLSTLKTQKGKDFDRAYMDSQVKAHKEVLATIDDKLMPSVQNQELKNHLTDVRKHVASHLAKAEELKTALDK